MVTYLYMTSENRFDRQGFVRILMLVYTKQQYEYHYKTAT